MSFRWVEDLSVTAWSMARLCYIQPELLSALVEQMLSEMDRFGPQDISNSAWSSARLAIRDQRLWQALSRAAKASVKQLAPQKISNTAWAFSTIEASGLFEARLAMACLLAVVLRCFKFMGRSTTTACSRRWPPKAS